MALTGEHHAWLMAGVSLLAFPTAAIAQDSAQDVRVAEAEPSASDAPATSGSPQADAVAAETSADIVVTARKRSESSIDVPVSITAVSLADIESRGFTDVDHIARLVPGLVLASAGTGIQGTAVLRGIGGTETNDLGDMPVSYNLDGVQVAKGSVRRLATIDLQQVEVLKGPQALFFGKNSPGGIISVRTADPGRDFEAKISTFYEFNAREIFTQGYVSGPLTENIGARLALYGTHRRGWVHMIVPEGEPLLNDWGPRNTEGGGRLTLRYDNHDNFSARLKINYSKLKGAAFGDTVQLVHCPYGQPQFGVPLASAPDDPRTVAPGPGVDDCNANGTGSLSDPVAFIDRQPDFGDGEAFARERQFLPSLEWSYDFAEPITLTSQTGFYAYKFKTIYNASATYIPQKMLAGIKHTSYSEFNQEFRVNSSYDGPLNFTLGAIYQRTVGKTDNRVYTDATAPRFLTGNKFKQTGEAYSAFAQLRWRPVPKLELAGGGRYTDETKKLPFAATGENFTQVTPETDKVHYEGWSPEATITWEPSSNITIFGAYRHGFLSGGFNTGSAPGPGIAYEPEFVKGFEAGIKTLLLDRKLRADLTFFDYDIEDLQVTVSVANATTQLRNAAKAYSRGIDFSANYRTPLEGLTLTGAVQYNKARYKDYLATCYRGLTAPTCRIFVSPITGNNILAQDLSGTEVFRAPKWAGNAGFVASLPAVGGFELDITGGMTFSSAFFTDAASKPAGRQKAYQLYDASVRAINGPWELALIGNNLTNEYYFTRGADSSNTGGTPGTSVSVLGDTIAAVSRGREIKLQVTRRF